MTLSEICDKYNLSNRSINLCLFNDFDSIEKILNYYTKYKSFINLKNCGRKSNEELIELCENFLKQKESNRLLSDLQENNEKQIVNVPIEIEQKITLFILEHTKHLSNRSRNGISYYLKGNFSSRNFIIKIINNQNFKIRDIENIGEKSAFELELYIGNIKKYIQKIIGEIPLNFISKNDYIENVLNDRLFRKTITNFIELKIKNLSERSRNVIFTYLDNKLNARNFINKILLNNNFSVGDLTNDIGRSNGGEIIEIEEYISNIRYYIYALENINDKIDYIAQKNKLFIQFVFNISDEIAESIKPFYLFKILDSLLNQNKLFKENYTAIFLSVFKIYRSSTPQTLDEIALKNDITRERVRQIRNELIEEIYEKLSFINGLDESVEEKFNIITSSNLIEITDDLADKINDLNETEFSNEFILFVLSIYLKDSHILIGKYEDILLHKIVNRKERYNWKNFYLVSKEIESLDFETLVNDIWGRVNERIEETYSFNFRSYISRFIKGYIDIPVIEKMIPIAEKILNDEFNLYLDIDENLIFERNTYKQGYKYTYEALEKLGKPSSVTEITEKIKELYPNYETSEASVRASMKRPYGFIPVGRQSVFGLQKWEDSIEDFKGGTIREIVINFLEDYNEPKHISAISEHIIKFRNNTNERSIIQNLKLDDRQRFIFFKDNYIGLKGVEYPQYYEIMDENDVVRPKSWEERYNDLQNFIFRYKRLPLSSGVDEEVKLYRWINVQKGKIKKYQLEEDKIELFNKLINFQV